MSNTVLIVDDAGFMRTMLRDILEEMGLNVVAEAADGVQAIKEFRRLQPDIVLLDTTLPDTDSLETLAEILTIDPQALVVMITPLGQRNQVLSAIKAGARDFLIKPFDEPRVTATLQHILQTVPL